jgi:hypothetical protein
MNRELLPTSSRGGARAAFAVVLVGFLAATSAWADGVAKEPASVSTSAKSTKTAKKPGDWRKLDAGACSPLSAEDKARLPAAWQPYLAFTRRCEMAAPAASAQVALISIFTLEYYEGKPDDAPWEKFPTPLLVDREFRCLGGLSQLFPWDQPAMLEIRHGRWKGGVPQEIRIHVDNPAVSGPYDLPTLQWNASQRRYHPVGPTDSKEDPCLKS